MDSQLEARAEEFETDQVSEYTEEEFTSDAAGSVDEVFNETPISADDIEEYNSQSDEEPETKQEQPDILSSSENKFDAIDFVSHVDSTPPPSKTEGPDLIDEPTDVTDDLNKPLDSESEIDQGESIPESDFQPLSSQPEEETPPENEEVPELFDVPEPPPDESLEDISLINRQGFTIEDSTESPIPQSDDKLELSGLTCLYIEDQVDSQILFKVQMKGLKDIKYAVSFEDALPLLDTESFDFIVMDINLQGEYNGLDALKIIHKMPKYEDIPIIAVTAYVLPGDKQKFIATGFNDFISKPIFREKMISSLEKIFLQKA
jgi:CheY-like chemotaxis protein